jgi:hypothetical protein
MLQDVKEFYLLSLHLVLYRGWLCHPLLITLGLVVLLARLLETKLGHLSTLCKISTQIKYKLRINT